MAGVTRIALIGLRGTGKTTVGALLASRLGWSFVDTDRVVEAMAGQSIARIFQDDGEMRFRDLEAEACRNGLTNDRVVLATGGGAILRPETRQLLHNSGFVVWLTGAPSVLASRIAGDGNSAQSRPNLTAYSGIAEIEALLALREPFYRKTAHAEVDTTNLSPDQIVDAIERAIAAKGLRA